MKIKEIPLPHEFTAMTKEGEAKVVIFETPDIPFFRGKCGPYQWACGKIQVWGDMDGETTIEEVKERVAQANPSWG